jgi:hypothetical protein
VLMVLEPNSRPTAGRLAGIAAACGSVAGSCRLRGTSSSFVPGSGCHCGGGCLAFLPIAGIASAAGCGGEGDVM